ncbi:MAG: fused MFS/spermidine synthase [Chloroflexi bacterium]|nr:fused MFS/spermidine synthase [Chloroflexota bacterium]
MNRNWLLMLLVFVAGTASLASEVAASRLIGPFFGTSVLVWAILIGNTLVYLTIGYALGGRLADRRPSEPALYWIVALAGFALGLAPFVARPVLLLAWQGFATYDAGVLGATLVGFNLIFAVPTILLGMVSPYAVRLTLGKVAQAGQSAGSVYALSTLGSIAGAYVPVFLLTPRTGARLTFVIVAAVMALAAFVPSRWRRTALIVTAGFATLSVELTASRVLGPDFGTSIQIWAVLIGMSLLYLTLGYEFGGRLADRWPNEGALRRVALAAAGFILLVPLASGPVLSVTRGLFAGASWGYMVGALAAFNLLFAIPILLLGMFPPFAIRLSGPLQAVSGAGHTAGSLYALSTVGSIVGTYAPVLVLVPLIGTRNTFLLFALALLAVAVLGLAVRASKQAPLAGGLVAVLAVAAFAFPQSYIKPLEEGGKRTLYETESLYNYIRVMQYGDYTILELNEGQAIHSLYNPREFLTGGVWDYFLVAPYFANDERPANVKSMALIGSAAGTVAKQYTRVYGPITIDGAEIDPEIVSVARQYFGMTDPNFTVYSEDGRYFLRNTQRKYDVIAVDAYRPPYIPFHLTTREFFADIKAHLNENGILVINAGHTLSDYGLVDVLGSTMKAEFPNVYALDVPMRGSTVGNSLVIATRQPTKLANFKANLAAVNDPVLKQIGDSAENVREVTAMPVVFTDDLSPVEEVVHRVLINFILTGQ